MPKPNFSRREILATLGLGAAFLPLLGSRRVLADSPSLLKPNVIFIAWPNGCEQFWPDGAFTPTDFTFPDYEECPIKPLAPWKDQLLFVGGLTLPNLQEIIDAMNFGGGHAALPFVYTGVRGVPFDGEISDGVTLHAGGPSLDYYLATKIAEQEGGYPSQRILAQRALRFDGDDVYVSFAGPVVGGKPNPVPLYDDPLELWNKLFSLGMEDQAEQVRILKEKKSVLDVAAKRLESTCSRLGKDDRLRCEKHLDSIREYEKLLAVVSGCSPSEMPDVEKDYLTPQANPLVPEIHRLQMGMLVSALACGTVRTGSLLWCNSNNNAYHFSWLADKDPALGGATEDPNYPGGLMHHHEIAHNSGLSEAHMRRKHLVDQWFMQQVADLMQMLYDVKEEGGTLLDRTLLVVTNLQNDGPNHSIVDLPFFLAGNCNGYFRTGRFHRWHNPADSAPAPINLALAEICTAMGFPHDSFGDYAGNLPILRA